MNNYWSLKTAGATRACATLAFVLAASLLLAQNPPPQQPAPVPIGNLSIPAGSLREVVDQLARALKINIILDPKVAGNVSIQTYGEVRNLDARNLLELILRINGFGMVQEGDLYRVVPMKDVLKQPIPLQRTINGRDIPEDDQLMLNLIFLKYVTVDELSKIIDPFTGDNAVLLPYAPANLLFVLDSRRNLRRLMDLISMFDSDTFANERVRLFELKNARPTDMEKELGTVLKSISLDEKTSTIKFLAVDRISTLIVVAPNPGVFDTVAEWIRKLDIPVTVTAGAVDVYVYHVRYARAECLAQALGSLYGSIGGYGAGYGYGAAATGGVSPYGGYAPANAGYGGAAVPFGSPYGGTPYGGGYGGGLGGGGYGGYGGGSYGAPNSFSAGFGGVGACGAGGVGGGFGGAGLGGYGYPSFGGYSAQAPVAPGGAAQAAAAGSPVGAATAAATPGAPAPEPPPRIVPNPLDNSLLIQADAQRYQGILKLLKELDVPPRQILLEARIYSIDLTDQFASGVSAAYTKRTGDDRSLLTNLLADGTTTLSVGALVGGSKQLLAFLNLKENVGHIHILSEPSLIATDSIPASINVGTQIPVSTGSTTLPSAGGVAVTQSISGVSTGITLEVNARVNPSGVVTLIVNQEVSSPVGSGSGNSLTPSFNQQTVQTQITTLDGDTIAIGGVIGETTTSGTAGIPVLSKIPYLGALFGSHTYSHERTELILFMTPHVIRDTADLLEASDELKTRIKKLQKYIKF